MLLLNKANIEKLVRDSNIRVAYATGRDLVCYCPFHHNIHSPSMTVSRETGLFNCFSPSCNAKGDLISLVAGSMRISFPEALRLIEEYEMSLDEIVQSIEIDTDQEPLSTFPEDVMEQRHREFWGSRGHDYMRGRGFTDETLEYFQIGYSESRDNIMVPVHSIDGILMGVVGRSVEGKGFHNSDGFQGRKTLFNIHRAKRAGSVLIVVEGSFDAMKVHQAGYQNVAALLKGTLTQQQAELIERTFNDIVIFVDNDDPSLYADGKAPGAELANKIYQRFRSSMGVYKVPFNRYVGKDATDMNEDQISYAMSGARLVGLDF